MPSPSLITSSSKANPQLSSGIQRSSRSPCSANASRLGRLWRLKSAGSKLFMLGTRREQCEHSNSPEKLTEESLWEHNRRQQEAMAIEMKNAKCSPYYKGLTDSSLVINRHRLVAPTSPGHESHATTIRTSTSSLSSFIFKVKELSSCMNMNMNTKKSKRSYPKLSAATTSLSKEMGSLAGKNSGSVLMVVTEKPLRERVSELEPTQKLQPEAAANEQSNNNRCLTERGPDSVMTSWTSNDKRGSIKNQGGPGDGSDTKRSSGAEKEKQFVWATKYRPKVLEDFICNREIALSLQREIKDGDCGHYIFEGKPGVGKRTMIWAMLRQVFGPEIEQARDKLKAFELKGDSRGTVEVPVTESSPHIEVNVSKLKGYEKHIIVELIKDMDNKSKTPHASDSCRAIILYDADRLSSDALLYIRWLLEKYKKTKLCFCCTDATKLQPIRSLCAVLHLDPPSKEEIVRVLEFIAEKEDLHLPHGMVERIADSSKNNLQQAIRSFEATWQKSYPFKEDQVILTGWEDDIALIAKNIIGEQSPKQLYKIRVKLRVLFEHDVSPHFVLQTLAQELKKHLTEPLQPLVDCLYEEYNNECGIFGSYQPLNIANNHNEEMDRRLQDPLRRNFPYLLGIEEFIARFMSSYKSHPKQE